MAQGWPGGWVWTARRLAVSAFVVVHLGATTLWVLPGCPLKARTFGVIRYYILPLGLWQYWGMFCPDPPRGVPALEAEVIDAQGLRHNFAFPKQTDYSVWQAIPRYRHPKFAMNLMDNDPELANHRVFAARHVVRRLGLPAEVFPVDVELVFQVRPCPLPGLLAADVSTARQAFPIGTYHFKSLAEVRP
jgi:hypothetical protein